MTERRMTMDAAKAAWLGTHREDDEHTCCQCLDTCFVNRSNVCFECWLMSVEVEIVGESSKMLNNVLVRLALIVAIVLAFLAAVSALTGCDAAREEATRQGSQAVVETLPDGSKEKGRAIVAHEKGDVVGVGAEFGKAAGARVVADSVRAKDPALADRVASGGWDYVTNHPWEILAAVLSLGGVATWVWRLLLGFSALKRVLHGVHSFCLHEPEKGAQLVEEVKTAAGDKAERIGTIADKEDVRVDVESQNGRVVAVPRTYKYPIGLNEGWRPRASLGPYETASCVGSAPGTKPDFEEPSLLKIRGTDDLVESEFLADVAPLDKIMEWLRAARLGQELGDGFRGSPLEYELAKCAEATQELRTLRESVVDAIGFDRVGLPTKAILATHKKQREALLAKIETLAYVVSKGSSEAIVEAAREFCTSLTDPKTIEAVSESIKLHETGK